MAKINLHSTVRHSDNFLSQRIDDEVVMISIEQGSYFSLDEVGSIIWDELARPKPISSLCEFLVAHSDADQQQCEDDVLEFLHTLHAEGMINIVA